LLTGLIMGDATSSKLLAPFAPDRFDAGQLLRTNQAGKKYGLLG
jgi:hypothetical protein